ncbi:MAG: LysR family transcriptional regulator [Oscillospiraceae bacterium]|nr:LysR family transcriptional regulator [Oscillospiraceae bacterium]
MTSKELECFMSVAENHSYVKSADLLFYSQPSISYQIKALEDELGFDLFFPGDRVNLTPAGKIVYKQMKAWNNSWKKALSSAKSASQTSREILHIGIRRPINEDFFTRGLKLFFNCQTEYSFCVHPYHIGGLISDLIQGSRDIVVADSLEVAAIGGLSYQPLCRSCWGFVIPSSDPLARKTTLRFSDMNGRDIIVPYIPEGMDETIFDAEYRRWSTPSNIFYSGSHENAVMTATAGVAFATINYSVPSQNSDSVYIPVEGYENHTHGLVWRKDDNRESVKLFVKSMKKVFLDQEGRIADFIKE